MPEERYSVVGGPDGKGRVLVRRLSDNLTARCKPEWLKPAEAVKVEAGAPMMAASRVKALRLDGLDWE